MAEPAWTPGPWQQHKNNRLIVQTVTPQVRGRHYAVAKAYADLGSQSDANARLIATAPELYAELTDLVMRFESACRIAGNDDEIIKLATAKPRAALAKARGER